MKDAGAHTPGDRANAKRGYRPDGTDLQANPLLSPAISIQAHRRAFLQLVGCERSAQGEEDLAEIGRVLRNLSAFCQLHTLVGIDPLVAPVGRMA
jgi:hypothetical protein